MDKEDLKEVLRLHKMWLSNEEGGKRANLIDADLKGAGLQNANLADADLRRADLRRANLIGADLRGADLRGADLEGANLIYADLRRADLRRADLRHADLRSADLRGAKLPKEFHILTNEEYHIQIFKDNVRVGCECHSVEKWLNFTNEEIEAMDGARALKFYPRLVRLINSYCGDYTTVSGKVKMTAKFSCWLYLWVLVFSLIALGCYFVGSSISIKPYHPEQSCPKEDILNYLDEEAQGIKKYLGIQV